MNETIGKKVYVKHFNKELTIRNVLDELVAGDEEARYVYQIEYKKISYILKGFKIQVEDVKSEDKKSLERFEQSLMKISEVYQEYHFARAASLISPHIAKPLSLDLIVELAEDRASLSYLNVQIIYECNGVALNKLQSTTIEQTYNLMRQSANALLLLRNLEIIHLDIKPDNIIYDAKKDLLKIVDMKSVFHGFNPKRPEATTIVKIKEEIALLTPEFAPPDVLFNKRSSTENLHLNPFLSTIDVYCWAMSFFAILTNRSNTDLKNYATKYKTGSEEDYKEFMRVVKDNFDSVKPNNSKEKELMGIVSDLLTKSLKYKSSERPTIEDAIYEMKKFEKEKKYILKYSKTELEYSKKLSKLYIHIDNVDSSLNDSLNKNRHNEEVKAKSEMEQKEVKVKDKEERKVRINKGNKLKSKDEIVDDMLDSSMNLNSEEETKEEIEENIIRELPPMSSSEIMKHMEVVKGQKVVWNKTHFIIALESGSN